MSDFQFPSWLIPVIIVVAALIVVFILAAIISKKTNQKYMNVLANLLWMVFVCWELAVIFFLVGCICFVTILFIPCGFQYFKLARLAIWPFGYKPYFTKLNGFKLALNIIWLILAGWEQAVLLFIVGAILCVTVIFIPCGLQLFKFARLVLMPLGTTIEKIQDAPVITPASNN